MCIRDSVETDQIIGETSARHVIVKNHEVDALGKRVGGLQAFCQDNRFSDAI